MKKLYIILYLLFSVQVLQAQIVRLPQFLGRMAHKDSSRRPSFFPLPVVGYSQETGFEFGVSALYSFYSDTANMRTRVSSVFSYATITTKGQNRLNLGINYWMPGNTYHYTAAINFINFPFNYYGIGNATNQVDLEKIAEKRLRLSFSGEKLLGKHIYLGLSGGAFNYSFYSPNTSGVFDIAPLPEDRNGGASIYLGPALTFDTRNNNTYTTHGFKFTSNYSVIKGILANNHYTGGILAVEFSQYTALAKRLTLAYDLYDNSLTGPESPFYLLPALGSNDRMRGYYNGRYRDRNYVAGQAELRYRLNPRIGLVGFGGTGTVFHNTFTTNELKPDYGAGFRYFFDVEKGLSLRFDYGIGEKRPGENRQKGFYIGLGEAF